jgi:hypothetical protein
MNTWKTARNLAQVIITENGMGQEFSAGIRRLINASPRLSIGGMI